MKLSIPKSELQRSLSRIQAIVEKRSSMPILSNVLLEATQDGDTGSLHLAATDLEVGLRSNQTAEVAEVGGLTVAAKKFYEVVRELPEETVTLTTTDNQYLELKCARSRFVLAGTAAEEYPTLPGTTPDKTVQVQAVVLASMIERTMYATSSDETRYNLNGVLFEVASESSKIRMVATDGHRLAMAERTVGSEAEGLTSGVIIPRKGLAELKRLVDEDDADEVEIGFEGNSGLVRKGDVTLVMRLIEGEFPNYQQVLPKEIGLRFSVPNEDLVRAVRRVSLLSAERTRAIKLELADGKLSISSSSPELGEAQEELDVDYSGEDLAIGFNAKYLMDALASMGSKEIEIGLKDELSPARVQPTDDRDTTAVVMPMRL